MSTSGGPTTGAGASPPLAGNLAADYTCTAALATFMTTAALAIGTWLLTCDSTAVIPATLGQTVEVEALAGTATAALNGCTSGELINPTADGPETGGINLSFEAVVTVAGTIVFQVLSSVAATALIKATTPTSALAKATGWTATRVA